ncbi:MAG: hypothetical protein NVS2B8_18980 [Vulcanimicrobiaceae bacterium]
MIGEVLTALVGGIAAGFAAGRRREKLDTAQSDRVEAPAPIDNDSRFEQLLRSLTVGIVTVDGRGYVDSLNAAAATIFDVGSRRMIGRALIEAVPSFDLDRRVRDALDGHPSRGRITFGSAVDARTLSVATLPLDGSAGVLIIAVDETRLFELEQTRRDFISSVSHELRTPLSSITLMIETILDNDGDQEALDLFLPRIKQEVDRMVHLVQDLLELARSESGRLRLRRESVDVSAIAATSISNFEPRAERQGVALAFTGEASPIDGDPDRLAQVFVNLVDNALRHTPAGGSVDVAVERDAGFVTVVVRDTGVGIPFNDLPHIFERFYVVDRSRARDAAGTGLGLSIVKQIVEAHGGTVRAQSEYGRGATITCAFPATRAAGTSL